MRRTSPMEDKKRAIKVSTLDELAEGFQESRAITDKLTIKQMIAFAKEPVGGGENKLAQVADETITELEAEDLQGATFIKDDLFYNCSQLGKISLPEGITKIGNSAFSAKNGLSINREFHIPKSLIETLGLVFIDVPQATVYYAGNLAEWCAIKFGNSQGSPLSSTTSHLYVNNNELVQGDITIPDEISTIEANAFYALADIKNVNTNNVQTIKRAAFAKSSIENIVFGSSLTTFSDLIQFSDCLSLKTVRFNSQPTRIASNAFIRSTNITDIYVPWSEGAVSGAPWGATNATIHYDTPIS